MKLVPLPNKDLVIPLDGFTLDGCRIMLPGEFELEYSKAETTISMCYFELHTDNSVKTIEARNRDDWPVLFSLLGSTVLRCHASFTTGILALEFAGGIVIRILPSRATEHWEVNISGDAIYKIYSMPGEGFDWVCISGGSLEQ